MRPPASSPRRLTTRSTSERSASDGSLIANATPTLAAAGIVVIETSTPTTAPDLARPRATTPAAPAVNATTNAPRFAPIRRPVRGRTPGRYGFGTLPNPAHRQHEQERGHRGQREPERQSAERGPRAPVGPIHQRHGKCGHRAIVGRHDHRAHDQDGVVGHDGDRGDDSGEHHQQTEAHRERRLVARSGGHLLPDDRVDLRRDDLRLCTVGRGRDDRLQLGQRDPAALGHARRLEPLDQRVRRRPNDVARHEISGWLRRATTVRRDVRDPGVVDKRLEHRYRERMNPSRSNEPSVDERHSVALDSHVSHAWASIGVSVRLVSGLVQRGKRAKPLALSSTFLRTGPGLARPRLAATFLCCREEAADLW